jgi:hypothetical protein
MKLIQTRTYPGLKHSWLYPILSWGIFILMYLEYRASWLKGSTWWVTIQYQTYVSIMTLYGSFNKILLKFNRIIDCLTRASWRVLTPHITSFLWWCLLRQITNEGCWKIYPLHVKRILQPIKVSSTSTCET